MNKPISDVMYIATQWYVTLKSGEATEHDIRAWQTWLEAHNEHQQAWQKLETLTQQFSVIDATSGLAVLSKPKEINKQTTALTSKGRRQALKQLSVFLGVGSISWLAYQYAPWQPLMADYATATGKQQHITLADGSQLFLNTSSLVNIDYTEQARNIQLIKGEILIETAHEQTAHYRPLSVITSQGKLTALGTRFSVKIISDANNETSNELNVYEGKVSVLASGKNQPVVVNAGEQMRFYASQYQAKTALDTSLDAWVKGFIVVDKMPLSQFIAEISRYKMGIIHCDPSICQLEISGAYPINDIEATLNSISKTLSLRIETFTPYWITLSPA